MKRRELIKLGSVLTSGAVLSNSAFSRSIPAHSPKTRFQSQDEIKNFGDERDWFFEKRFGLFVHWGLYAIPAWHEQMQQRAEGFFRKALSINPDNAIARKKLSIYDKSTKKKSAFSFFGKKK